jgi:hypothetical protein
MHKCNEEYWYTQWHLDEYLHRKLFVKNVKQIIKTTENEVSIYADTDSLFVSFKPAMTHCDWKNQIFSNVESLLKPHIILYKSVKPNVSSSCLLLTDNISEFIDFLKGNSGITIIVDGNYVKNYSFRKMVSELGIEDKIKWNWSSELDFIQGVDYYRFGGYFKSKLDLYADGFGVANKEDFELERISESIINIAKKKYIQHIVYEDGIPYDRMAYIYPKGVELVRSSTPLFARDKIVDIVKYLFQHPDSFNIRELLNLVKNLRKEFDLCVPDRIDEIAMQSSCSNYEEKVIDDKDKLSFVTGAHFAVKASAFHNHLLYKNKKLQEKYEFIKSGTKIKYYYCKDKSMNDIFAYIRGSYPVEMAPDIDLKTQFAKCILSPINSIIEPLGLPSINERLSVVMSIFG